MTRRVMVFEHLWENGVLKGKREVGAGNFHQFGVDYEEFDTGPGSFSTAIVEMPDGTIINPSVELIRFDDAGDGA